MSLIYTYKDLQDQVLSWLDEGGDAGTTLTNVKNGLNQALQRRVGQQDWPFMRWHPTETFTLTSGQSVYTLHSEFWRPEYFRNVTKQRFVSELPKRQLGVTDYNTSVAQVPDLYRLHWGSPVAAQPSAASVLTIVSDNAGDTSSGSKSVIIRGIAGGVQVVDTVVPSGTTPVAGTKSFTRILGITKAGTWLGTLTVTSNAAAVTNLVLNNDEYARQYPLFELLTTPDALDTIEYSFYRKPLAMVYDNDIPDIPSPHSQILVWDTLILFGGYNTDASPQAVAIWSQNQKDLELAMKQQFLEAGNTVAAKSRYIIPDDEDQASFWPRIYRNQ